MYGLMVYVTMAAAARGIAVGPQHPRTAAAHAPLFCAGFHGDPDDDDFAGAGQQGLWVNLTQSQCTASTLPLLASYLGANITAGDLGCLGLMGGPPAYVVAASESACSRVPAAFNARLGGTAFSCFDDGLVGGTGHRVPVAMTCCPCRARSSQPSTAAADPPHVCRRLFLPRVPVAFRAFHATRGIPFHAEPCG